jgi:hypothetical protein
MQNRRRPDARHRGCRRTPRGPAVVPRALAYRLRARADVISLASLRIVRVVP